MPAYDTIVLVFHVGHVILLVCPLLRVKEDMMGTFGGPGVPPGGQVVLRYTDLLINQDKADNRGVVIQAVKEVMKTSLDQWRITEDPRFLELVLRSTDRLTKLLKLDEPEGPKVIEQSDPEELVRKVRADLLELEARLSGE